MDPLHLVAYIDAGTGSYILAAIASGVAGLWFLLRSWAAKIKRKVTGQPAPTYSDEDEADGADEQIVAPQRTED